jgi:hypothetical protein
MGFMTCSPGGYKVESYSYFDNGFNLQWCPTHLDRDSAFKMSAVSNLGDEITIDELTWRPDVTDLNCLVANILGSRTLSIKPIEPSGMYTPA